MPSGGVGTRKRTDIGARRKLEEVDFPAFTFPRWTRAWNIRTVCETE